MNHIVDASVIGNETTQTLFVRSIDNGTDLQFCNISSPHSKFCVSIGYCDILMIPEDGFRTDVRLWILFALIKVIKLGQGIFLPVHVRSNEYLVKNTTFSFRSSKRYILDSISTMNTLAQGRK